MTRRQQNLVRRIATGSILFADQITAREAAELRAIDDRLFLQSEQVRGEPRHYFAVDLAAFRAAAQERGIVA